MPSAARRPASTTRGSIDPVPEVKGRRVASRRIPAPNREKTELSPPTPAVITVRVPLAIYRRRARKLVFTPDGEPRRPQPARIDNSMVKALARAFRWRKLLETGVHGTIDELAKAETINPSYVSRILRLHQEGLAAIALDHQAMFRPCVSIHRSKHGSEPRRFQLLHRLADQLCARRWCLAQEPAQRGGSLPLERWRVAIQRHLRARNDECVRHGGESFLHGGDKGSEATPIIMLTPPNIIHGRSWSFRRSIQPTTARRMMVPRPTTVKNSAG